MKKETLFIIYMAIAIAVAYAIYKWNRGKALATGKMTDPDFISRVASDSASTGKSFAEAFAERIQNLNNLSE